MVLWRSIFHLPQEAGTNIKGAARHNGQYPELGMVTDHSYPSVNSYMRPCKIIQRASARAAFIYIMKLISMASIN
jgi:hypothetical protein